MKWFISLALVLIAGCTTPPTALEQHFFDVATNRVPVVTAETNTVWVTNAVGAAQVTNVIWRTNEVDAYVLTPNERADTIAELGRAIGAPFGVGELVGMALAGLFGIYGTLRSRKANKTAAVLAQVIETGRIVLQSTPQGQALDERWVRWMQQHQAEAGVMQEVMRLLASAVNTDSAKGVAGALCQIMEQKK